MSGVQAELQFSLRTDFRFGGEVIVHAMARLCSLSELEVMKILCL